MNDGAPTETKGYVIVNPSNTKTREQFGVVCHSCKEIFSVSDPKCEVSEVLDKISGADRRDMCAFYTKHDGHNLDVATFELEVDQKRLS